MHEMILIIQIYKISIHLLQNNTDANFIRVGGEFAQKYLSEGSRMVRDVFRSARKNVCLLSGII